MLATNDATPLLLALTYFLDVSTACDTIENTVIDATRTHLLLIHVAARHVTTAWHATVNSEHIGDGIVRLVGCR